MKSQKTNAFQLAIAGGVLVLVLVCATFAWFAVGDHAWVKSIEAKIFSPKVSTQLNSIEYSPSGNPEGNDWVDYDGKEALPIEPGKELHFRASFTAASTQVAMDLINIHPQYRAPETTQAETTTASPDGGATQPSPTATTLPPVSEGESAKLVGALEYRVSNNPTKDWANDDTWLTLKFTDDGTYRVARILEPTAVGSSNVQHTYYYDIKMKEEAGNEYMNMFISFDLSLVFEDAL